MRIGIDIDGTMTNFEEFVVKYGTQYMKKKYNIELANANGYDLNQVFELEKAFVSRGYTAQKAKKMSEKVLNEFWNKYYVKYVMSSLKKGIKETIDKLKEDGDEIIIISSRKKATSDDFIGKFVKASIIEKFRANGIKYDSLILKENDEEKLKSIKDNYIDIMIDDKPELIEKISKFTDVICMNASYNKDYDIKNRVDGFENLELYNKISNIKKELESPIKNDSKQTGKPSLDKVYLKYYHVEDKKWTLCRKNPYVRMMESNKDTPYDVMVSYLGKKGKNLTAKEFETAVDNCAKKLVDDGIKENDIVPMLVVNSPETLIMMTALMKIKATFVPISPLETEVSIESKIATLNPKMIYCVDYYNEKEKAYVSAKVNNICDRLKINKVVYSRVEDSLKPIYRGAYSIKQNKNGKAVYDDRYTKFDEYLKQGSKLDVNPNVDYSSDYTVCIIYTGGTVEPKAVKISANNIDAEVRHFLSPRIGIKRNEKITGYLPLDHIYGLLINFIVPYCKSMEICLRPKINRNNLYKIIKEDNVNDLVTIPVLLEDVLDSKGKDYLKNINLIASGSAAIKEDTLSKLKEINTKANVIDGYGSSETTSMILENGHPILESEVKIVDPITHRELGYNESGELCVNSPTIMQGYYNNELKTSEVLKRHGDGKIWYHTKDMYHVTEDGTYHYDGRLDNDIIKVNGQAVNIFAVNAVIESLPIVKKSIILGVKDDKMGNKPVAVVELKEEAKASTEFKKYILDYCSNILTYYERPKDILFVDEMPITLRGKIDGKKLQEMYYNANNEEKIKGISR